MQPIMTFVGNLGYVAVAVLGSVLAVKRHDRGRRYPGVYPVCEKFHTADHTDCAGFKHAAVLQAAVTELAVFKFLDEEE